MAMLVVPSKDKSGAIHIAMVISGSLCGLPGGSSEMSRGSKVFKGGQGSADHRGR